MEDAGEEKEEGEEVEKNNDCLGIKGGLFAFKRKGSAVEENTAHPRLSPIPARSDCIEVGAARKGLAPQLPGSNKRIAAAMRCRGKCSIVL